MGGDVIEVHSLVGAACGEDNLLCLFRDGCGRGREGECADCGGMCGEEEGICELNIVVGRYGGCDAVKNSVVGTCDDLDSEGGFGWGCWFGGSGWFDLFAGDGRSSGLGLEEYGALSFGHFEWLCCGECMIWRS